MSQNSNLKIEAFSDTNLFDALSNKYCSAGAVSENDRAKYLCGYLRDIGVKTTVIEYDYTDGDYVDDFASYYVKCFEPYEVRCKRVHFFSDQDLIANEHDFIELASNEMSKEKLDQLNESYLGFIVARPLPQAVIGRTILKTYDSASGSRHYTATLDYAVNLFGIPLTVRSLVYQEQDTVVAACATVALWSAFHKASDLFGTQTPRPSAITVSANQVVSDSRSIPSKGLIVEQMCSAISQQGLEPEIVRVVKDLPLRSLLYGYLRMGLTPIAIVAIESKEDLHAVSFAGYSICPARIDGFEPIGGKDAIPMIGGRIDAFYGHDDQIGPFAKHTIEKARGSGHHQVAFSGTWQRSSGTYLQVYPIQIIIPVYNKIRVGYTDVQLWLIRLNDLVRPMLQNIEYEWELYLTTNNNYKDKIKSKQYGNQAIRSSLILRQHPRFIWRALLRVKGELLFEILFDATDIPNSFTGYCMVWHLPNFKNAMKDALDNLCAESEKNLLIKSLTEKYLHFLRESVGHAQDVYFHTAGMPPG